MGGGQPQAAGATAERRARVVGGVVPAGGGAAGAAGGEARAAVGGGGPERRRDGEDFGRPGGGSAGAGPAVDGCGHGHGAGRGGMAVGLGAATASARRRCRTTPPAAGRSRDGRNANVHANANDGRRRGGEQRGDGGRGGRCGVGLDADGSSRAGVRRRLRARRAGTHRARAAGDARLQRFLRGWCTRTTCPMAHPGIRDSVEPIVLSGAAREEVRGHVLPRRPGLRRDWNRAPRARSAVLPPVPAALDDQHRAQALPHAARRC